MAQFKRIKKEQPDAILFFRMGDFYEMFYDDAVVASRVLGIALTSRSKGPDGKGIPMCGVPYHAGENYIAPLVENGYRVAICEQVTEPDGKGIVDREVIRIVTPGTVLEQNQLDAGTHCYLASLAFGRETIGFALADLSAAVFQIGEFHGPDANEKLLAELWRLEPRELLVPLQNQNDAMITLLFNRMDKLSIRPLDDFLFDPEESRRLLHSHFKVASLDGFGCQNFTVGIGAAGAVLDYLKDTQRRALGRLIGVSVYDSGEFMALDLATQRNLELVKTLTDGSKKGSLIGLLDHTQTPMGGRLLRDWITRPLTVPKRINARLDAVEELSEAFETSRALLGHLKEIADMERLTSRISLKLAHARDLLSLKRSLAVLPPLLDLVKPFQQELLKETAAETDPLTDVFELVEKAIHPNPPLLLREGNLIRDGYDSELDKLRAVSREGKSWIAELEAKERKRTGINSLRVSYNKVFGYYMEVPKGRIKDVPDEYIRRQTLVGSERYITPALKEHEDLVLGAEDRAFDLEYDLFCSVRDEIASHTARILKSAGQVGRLDVLAAFARIALEKNYCKPAVDNSDRMEIRNCRHPTVESALKSGQFVPNDVYLDTNVNQLIILTGPNMAGKSTYLRQVALVVLMAQIGSFVPADSALIGVVDRIFTRIGAGDALHEGKSAFLVEMSEAANILNNATPRSLVILDEVGRGTSTFDGLSIAWALAEYIHDAPTLRARTLFATHYHELTDLVATRPRVKNFSVTVQELPNDLVFLYKIQPGACSRSHGIQVGRMAGLPAPVIERAKEILANLEKGEFDADGNPVIAHGDKSKPGRRKRPPKKQETIFSASDGLLHRRLDAVNLDRITPIEALNILSELKRLIAN